jgi:hypothetical protein
LKKFKKKVVRFATDYFRYEKLENKILVGNSIIILQILTAEVIFNMLTAFAPKFIVLSCNIFIIFVQLPNLMIKAHTKFSDILDILAPRLNDILIGVIDTLFAKTLCY